MQRVSAIVPVFNGARFLPGALDSALEQRGQGFEVEVVVVDDGSSDASFDIATAYQQRHPDRVRIIRQERGGPASARNRGAREARGEWLAFLDSDDVWLPGKLERQLALARPGTGLIYTDRCTFDNGRRLSDDVRLPRGDVFEELLRHNFVTASSVLMRSDAFEQLGGFCAYIYGAEDWDLWLRFAHGSDVELCPEPLTRYRRHSDGISSNPCALFLAQCKVLARALEMPRGRQVDRAALRRAIAGMEHDEAEDARPFSGATRGARTGLAAVLLGQNFLRGSRAHLTSPGGLSRAALRSLRQVTRGMVERRGAAALDGLPAVAAPRAGVREAAWLQ